MIQSTRKKLLMRFCLIIAMVLLIPMQFTQSVVASTSKSSLGSSMANQNLFNPLACEYEGKIYYASFSAIYVINRDEINGGVTTTCICYMDDDLRPEYLTVLGKYIYAIVKTGNAPYGRLARIDPDSGQYKIYKGKKYNYIEKLCAAKGRLYYYKSDITIYSMKADGSARRIVKKGCHFLAMNEKRIYYTASDTVWSVPQSIYSCDLNGKHVKKLYQSKYPIYNLIEENGYIYFSFGNAYSTKIYRKKRSHHSNAKKIYGIRISRDSDTLDLLDVDKKYIYFVNKKHRLTRLNRKTGKTKKVLGGYVRGVRGIFNDVMIVEFWSGTYDFSCKLIDRTTGEVIKTLYMGRMKSASG